MMFVRVAKRWAAAASGVVLIAGLMVAGAGVASADEPAPDCSQAGTSGFTAAVVAAAGQTISRRTINATGCDVGIYVDAPDVTISQVTVKNANAAGILVFDTHDVTVMRSTVTGNGFVTQIPASHESSAPGDLPQAFAISLFGVSDALVTQNKVYNNGRGGIGVMDDGPSGPGRVVGGPGFPMDAVSVSNVIVSRNTLWANYSGCAIVVSAFNFGNTVSGVTITQNTVRGTGFGELGADVGGIVAQSNGPYSTVSNITISRNTVTDSVEAGVIVHAAAPGSQTANVTVTRNTLSGNNLGYKAPDSEVDNTAGVVVSVIGPPPNVPICPNDDPTSPLCFINPGEMNESTVVSRNKITDQYYGVWTSGPNPPTLFRNDISATVDVYTAPPPSGP